MASRSNETRSDDRSIVHCLRCRKPQRTLAAHLSRVCMKDSTQAERAAELQKAKASCREWVLGNRTWNYNRLCEILPDRCSQIAMAKELHHRGFFLENLPQDVAQEIEGEPVTAVASSSQTDQSRVVAPSIQDCQWILRVAKNDFKRTRKDLQMDRAVLKVMKNFYRYYCEAILVYRHMQRPGAVEALTDAEWVDRIPHAGRVVVGVRMGKKSNMQIALTLEEEESLELYYTKIRPENILPEKFCQSFFLSSYGDPLPNITVDMNGLHKRYTQSATFSSQDVRRAVMTAALDLPAQQRDSVKSYLNNRVGAVEAVVDAAVLLDSLAGSSSGDDSSVPLEEGDLRKDFNAFAARFPVTLEANPPSKKQRVDSGFPDDRYLYDRWRTEQYAQREAYLLSYFTLRKPSAAKVARLIATEGWTGNCPKPEDIVQVWKPATKDKIETDPHIFKCVSEQTWAGVVIKYMGTDQGYGVLSTRPFSKGDVVCDYHGKLISGAQGRVMMAAEENKTKAGYLFFFKAGERDLCIDAETFPCDCHPGIDTFGRRINHSSKVPNLKPCHVVLKGNGEAKDVIIFKALHDIKVGTQLKFDYGIKRHSFGGEGVDLAWLDE